MTNVLRMFDLTSGNLTPVVNFEGISKNIMTVGFQVWDTIPSIEFDVYDPQAEGRWMYTGGEDCTARIWDLKMRNLSCQVFSASQRTNDSPDFHSESSKQTPLSPVPASIQTSRRWW